MIQLAQILLGWLLADALSGLYHIMTDYGYNIPHQIKLFMFHHENPHTMTFDWQPLLAGVPLIIVGLFWHPWFLISLGFFISISQVGHYYTHHKAPAPIRILQRVGVLISPKHHADHHKGDYNKNFCIFTGINNIWLNPLAKLLVRFKRI